MTISANDVMRVAVEIMHTLEDEEVGDDLSHRRLAEEWAERQGIEPQTMPMVCNSVREAFDRALFSAAAQLETHEMEIDGQMYTEANDEAMTWAMELTVIAAFRWGFETARQYAPSTVVTEDEETCEHKWRDMRFHGGDFEGADGIVCRDCGKVAPPEVAAQFMEEDS